MIKTLVPTFDNSFIGGLAYSGKTRLMFEEVTCLLLHHLNPAIKVLDQFPVHPPPGLHIIVIETELYDEAMTDLFRSTIYGHDFSPDEPRIEDWLNARFTWVSKEDNFRFNTPTDRHHGQDGLIKVIQSFIDDFTGDGQSLDDFRILIYIDSLKGVGDPGASGTDIEKFQQVEREMREIEATIGCRIAWRILHHSTRGNDLAGGEQVKGWARFTVKFNVPKDKRAGYCYLNGTVIDHDGGDREIGAAMLTQVDPDKRPTNIRFTKDKVTFSALPPGTEEEETPQSGPRRNRVRLSRTTEVAPGVPPRSAKEVIKDRIVDFVTQATTFPDRQEIGKIIKLSRRALDPYLVELVKEKRLRKHGTNGIRQTFGGPEQVAYDRRNLGSRNLGSPTAKLPRSGGR
jgi:hypothetical protein